MIVGYCELARELLEKIDHELIMREGNLAVTLGGVSIQPRDGTKFIPVSGDIRVWRALQLQSAGVMLQANGHQYSIDVKQLRRFVTRTFTIFYSWQSWLPVATNKDLIRDALDRAVVDVNKNENIQFDIDSDLVAVAGATSFATEILHKIANAHIFVADVSAVGGEYPPEKRPNRTIPNANVMFEYGYASAKINTEQIILVHNNAYARVEELPSDIRHNKVLTYTCLAHNVQTVDDAKKMLSEQFVKELTSIAKKLLAE